MKFKNLFSVFIQDTVHKRKQLTKKQCEEWLRLVAKNQSKITLRIVSENESQKLNKQFRNKDVPTNVLSFLMLEDPIEGDLVLCHHVIKKEAKAQNKKIQDKKG